MISCNEPTSMEHHQQSSNFHLCLCKTVKIQTQLGTILTQIRIAYLKLTNQPVNQNYDICLVYKISMYTYQTYLQVEELDWSNHHDQVYRLFYQQ